MMRDLLRGSSRNLARRPGLVASVLITFVLGIAANGVVFNLVYDALVRPFPYGDAGRLALVLARPDSPAASGAGFAVTLPQFREWQARSTSFEHAALYTVMRYTASGVGESALVRVAVVSAEFFATLQVQAVQGRTWSRDEDASPFIVVSRRYWRRHGGLDVSTATVSMALNGVEFSVIGVMDERVELLTGETDGWIPLETARRIGSAQFREGGIFGMVGRLAPTASLQNAEQELARILGDMPGLPTGGPSRLLPMHEQLTRDVREPLLILLGIVVLLYLVSTTNLASATLIHAISRTKEFAVRSALGATRRQLTLQGATEAGLLGAVGIIATLVTVWWATHLLASMPFPGLSFTRPSALSGASVFYMIVLAVGAVAIMVFVSIIYAAGSRLSALRLNSTSGSRMYTAFREALVATQIVLSVMLLTLALGFTQTLAGLLAHDVGMDPRNTLIVEIGLSTTQYSTLSDQAIYVQRLRERLQQLPGVRVAGVGTALPARRALGELVLPLFNESTGVREFVTFDHVPASPGYLEAIGARLHRGRLFEETDTELTAPVAVVSQRAAQRLFGTQDVLGRDIRVGRLPTTRLQTMATIVGVVGDIRYGGLEAEPNGAVYIPFGHRPIPRIFSRSRRGSSRCGWPQRRKNPSERSTRTN